ncbi:hypothetical protein MD21A_iyMicDemo21aOGSv2.0-000092 [Microplitis demolitor]
MSYSSVMDSNNPEEPVNPEEPIDLSLRKSIDSDDPDNSGEPMVLCRLVDSDESIGTEELMNQSMDSDEPLDIEELISRFKIISRKSLTKKIRLTTSSLAERSPKYVEWKIRGLQSYRENFHYSSLHWATNDYVHAILPNTVAYWWFNIVILIEEYYRELVTTVIFLADNIGPQKMIEVILINLIDIDGFFTSGDQVNLVKRQCHKMAMQTIGRMMSMREFNPTDVCPYVKIILNDLIRQYKETTLLDPVMLNGINSIVNKLNLRV